MNNSDNFAHLPQNSAELERAVLGVMLTSSTGLRDALGLLKTDDTVFYHPPHKPIFKAIRSLHEANMSVDYITVNQKLAAAKQLAAAGGASYVRELLTCAPRAAGLADYCFFMLHLAAKRQITTLMQRLIQQANDPASDVHEMLAEGYTAINNIQQGLQIKGAVKVGDLLGEVAADIVAAAKTPGGLTGVPSGLTKVDKMTGGWQPSDLIIIAARPGVGKTSFALANAAPAAYEGHAGAIFNLEMSNKQMVTKMLASELKEYSTSQLRTGYFPSGGVEEAKTLAERGRRLHDAEIYIDDTPGLSINEFRSKAARLKAEHDIKWIIVDYLQLMTAPGKGSREQEIAAISRGLKLTAKELGVPVLALSQLSRAVESRGGEKKPLLSDLRESGSIEQDADVVIFLYRPDYYKITEDAVGESVADTTDVIFAKHRNGPLGEVTVGSTMKNGHYFDLDLDTYVPAPKPAQPTTPTRFVTDEQFGPRILGLRTASPSDFSDDGAPVS